ncbi:MAG: ribose-5-phosphate isomerase RpiA [Bacteroidota bacterium]|nr:ribose-5-phosphate isomerase RpiA [Bacteroidota bacterium]
MLSREEIKKNVGIYAAGLVKPGMAIGLGTGTTAYWLIKELGARVKEGLQIMVIPTSAKTGQLAKELGIAVSDLNAAGELALTIDGADEIDPEGQLIKGGGGALLQEKIVAAASRELVIIADSSKQVDQLGKFPLPVEVIPFGYKQVIRQINQQGLCSKVILRQVNGYPFITDHSHYILDCEFVKIEDASSLNVLLHGIPGVVETGLFIHMTKRAIIGYPDGRVEVTMYK